MKYTAILFLFLSVYSFSQFPDKITVSGCFVSDINGNYTKSSNSCRNCSFHYDKDGFPDEELYGEGSFWKWDDSGQSFQCPDPHDSAHLKFGGVCGNILCPTFGECLDGCIVEENNILPIELEYFTVELESGHPKLIWRTTSEINNDYFELQRSSHGLNWEIIEFIEGNGTTNVPKEYEFVDSVGIKGVYYYRLRQIDYDGDEEYSDVVSLEVGDFFSTGGLEIYPNPTTQKLIKMEIPFEYGTNSTIVLRNSAGQTTFMKSFIVEYEKEFFRLNHLPGGVYHVTLSGETQTFFTTVLLE